MGKLGFESVRKTYNNDSIVAVKRFDLDVPDGEFLTVVGPSGSGKSTIMRMVAGLEDITDGEIRLNDTVVNDLPPQDRDVAMVFQNYALYPHLTARQNMSYGLKLSTDLPKDEIETRVEETAAMLDITELLDKKPGNLSGGQQQRVATGRAIVREPQVFLMDEPLSNLDAKLRVHMRTELQRLHERLDTTTLYVTHDQEEAMTMSDRIAIIDGGELQQVGPPEEIYDHPANRFVAEFIGSPSMNFFDVECNGAFLVCDAFDLPVSADLADEVSKNVGSEPLVLGVRPEDLRMAAEDDHTIPATVEVREPIGSDNYLYLDINGTECTMRVGGKVKPEEGSRIEITIDEDDIHLFEANSGVNLLAEPASESEPDSESVSAAS